MNTSDSPKTPNTSIKKVAILSPVVRRAGANAVISTARRVVHSQRHRSHGIKHGYSGLVEFAADHPMVEAGPS